MKTRPTALLAIVLGLLTSGGLVTSRAEAVLAPSSAPVAPAPNTPLLRPTGIIRDVQKLVQAGTDASVVNAYIQSWSTPYSVSAEDILRLHDAGVASDILTGLIRHSSELSAARQATVPAVVTAPTSAVPPSASPEQVAPAPAYPVAPAPAYVETPPVQYTAPVVYSYPEYVPYYYPSYNYCYGYPYSYGWPFGVSFSYSWGGRYYGRSHFYGHGFEHRSYPIRAGYGGHGYSGFAGHGGYVGHGGFGGRSFGGHSFGGRGGGFHR